MAAGLVKASPQDSVIPLTNRDVVLMVKSGLSSEVITAKINSSSCNFDTFPSVLDELKSRGVSNEVILAMVNAPHGAPKTRSNKTEVREFRETPDPPKLVKVSVSDGTPIEIETAYTVTSADVEEGNAITFHVVHPVKVNGTTIIESGAVATARVIKAKKGGSWGRAGQIAFAMQDVAAVDGSRVPLQFTKSAKGDSKGGTVATGAIITGLLFWPAAPLWGLKHGKNAVIPAGKRFEVFVHGDTDVSGRIVADAEKR